MEALILLYFLPDTAANYALRQCLSYFFPAFCYSSTTNQSRFSKVGHSFLLESLRDTSNLAFIQVVTGAFIKLCPVYEELLQEAQATDEDIGLIQPERVISILLDYSDPHNLV